MTTTTNMGLELPEIGVTTSPDWAQLINDAMQLLDEHDHSSGKGVKVKTSGISIDGDLSFNSNNLQSVRGSRFSNQTVSIPATGSDQLMLYARDGELYYNDNSGNEVRITLSGSIDASASGGFTGLTSPAAAVYSPGTFRFDQDTNQRASLSAGNVVIAEPGIVSPKTLTIEAPADSAMAASYNLEMAANLPSQDSLYAVSSSGVSTYQEVDTIGTFIGNTGADNIASTITQSGANTVIATSNLGDITSDTPGTPVTLNTDGATFTDVASVTVSTAGTYLILAVLDMTLVFDNGTSGALNFIIAGEGRLYLNNTTQLNGRYRMTNNARLDGLGSGSDSGSSRLVVTICDVQSLSASDVIDLQGVTTIGESFPLPGTPALTTAEADGDSYIKLVRLV